jgi:hypothetical protein
MGCCGRRRARPPLSEQARNFGLSLANVMATAVRTGKIKVNRETMESRIRICRECRHLAGARCNVCGCFVSLKAGLKAEGCPIKKW